MSITDPILNQATASAMASSTEFNENMNDLEDTSLATFGTGVIDGGACTIGTGLNVNVAAATYLLGIVLPKEATVVPIAPSKTDAILWAVADPDADERVAYEWAYLGETYERGCQVCKATSDGAAVTSVTIVFDGRVDMIPYADLIAAVNADQVVSIAMGDANLDLSDGSDTSLMRLRARVILLTGALTALRNLVLPPQKQFIVVNATTGGFGVSVKTMTGSGLTLANAKSASFYSPVSSSAAIVRLSADYS